jgi:spore maturation protein CgeB
VQEFFFGAARTLPDRSFLLAGAGWEPDAGTPNVRYLGHLPPGLHNAFNCSALAVLNVTRESMAENGWSPPTRVFEAAGAGACLMSDAWDGIEEFLAPGEEVIVCADGSEVAEVLRDLDAGTAQAIGARARERIIEEHTYAHRAREVEEVLAAQEVCS